MVKSKIDSSELIENLSVEQKKVFSNMLRAEQKRILEMGKENAIQAIDKYELRPIDVDFVYRKREVGEEVKKEALMNYGQAVSKYAQYNSVFRDKREDFHQIREQLRECIGSDNEECENIEEKALENARNFIINGAYMTIEHLNKIKNLVLASEEIDDEKAQHMVIDIKKAIEEMHESILVAKAAETKEEIREAARDINSVWNRFKNRERLYVANLVSGEVWNILRRSELLEQRLDNILDDMEKQGIDIEVISEKVDEFSEYVLDAKIKYNEASSLLKSSDTYPDLEMIDEARELLRQAHEDLKDAHRLLIEIINEIKESGGDITDETKLNKYELYELIEVDEK